MKIITVKLFQQPVQVSSIRFENSILELNKLPIFYGQKCAIFFALRSSHRTYTFC